MAKINTTSYSKIDKLKGTLENNTGLKVGLVSKTTQPANTESSDLIIENGEKIMFRTESNEFLYAKAIGGTEGVEYEVGVAGFSHGRQTIDSGDPILELKTTQIAYINEMNTVKDSTIVELGVAKTGAVNAVNTVKTSIEGIIANNPTGGNATSVGALTEPTLNDRAMKSYAMGKAEFKALQEERKRNNAGSGFKEWGKHANTSSYKLENINQGMYARYGDSNRLVLGRGTSLVSGISRTEEAITVVNGIQHKLSDGQAYDKFNIKFPPAPDGTKTYDSATGVVTTHASSNEAFEGLVTNGDFRNGTTGWSKSYSGTTLAVTNGVMKVTPNGTNQADIRQSVSTVSGTKYRFEVNIVSAGGSIRLLFGSSVSGGIGHNLQTGLNVFELTKPTGANNTIYIIGESSVTSVFEISSISVMPVTESVITSRQDLVFLETFEQAIDLRDDVFGLGNVQFGASSFDGISTVYLDTIGVQQGYSAFGQWDTATKGRGMRWSTLSDTNKKKLLDNPENNIYYDSETDKLIQVRYRIRVIEGLGNQWQALSVSGSNKYIQYDLANKIKVKGVNESTVDYTNNSAFTYNTPNYAINWDGGNGEKGGWYTHNFLKDRGVAIPICLVQRLNQGAYHPAHNPEGCARLNSNGAFNSGSYWYNSSAIVLKSKSECFNRIKGNADLTSAGYVLDTGDIQSTWSGRPDKYKFYDAIYAGQVRDLRLDCNVKDVNQLREDATRKAIAGETRGYGKVPFTKVLVSNSSLTIKGQSADLPVDQYSIYVSGLNKYRLYYNKIQSTYTPDYIILSDGTNTVELERRSDNFYYHTYKYGVPTNVYNGLPWSNVAVPNMNVVVSDLLSAQYDELQWTDIMATPETFKTRFPNGCIGQWIPYIPTGTTFTGSLNRKMVNKPYRLRHNGTSWTGADAPNYDAILNTSNSTVAANEVLLFQYETKSNFTQASTNSKVIGSVGDVLASSDYNIYGGNRLNGSLTGNIAKSNISGNREQIPILNRNLDYKPSTLVGNLMHASIALKTPANSSKGFKTLTTLTEKDGLLYMQYHYKELVYDATGTVGNKWGDIVASTTYQPAYSTIPIRDNDGTMTDLNGKTVKYGCHTESIPIGIASHKGGM